MNKIKIKKDIEDIQINDPITWKDIKDFQFEDDDIISIGYEDGFYYCRVERMVEETDEEYEDRMERKRNSESMLKKNRYEQYLRLKKEFEGE